MFDAMTIPHPSSDTAPSPVPGADRLSERTPSPAVVALLARPPDPASGPYERLERIATLERAIAWLQTLQGEEMAEYLHRAERAAATDPAPGAWTVADATHSATAEIAMLLHLTAATATTRLQQARQLTDPGLAPTAALARDGLLTHPKIVKILDGAFGLTPHQTERFQARILPKAPTQTTGQLAAAVSRFLTGLSDHDRDLPARRCDRATRTRAVVLTPEPDGMATLRAFLPAAAATGIYAVLDEHARHRPRTDPRTMDHRRADALVDLVLRDTGHTSTGTAEHAARNDPAPGPGDGPDREVPGIAPAPPGGSPFVGNTVTVRINVTVPIGTLLGTCDDPADLAGHGPLPAADARALAYDPDSVWYRLLTDPATGRLLDHGTTRYRPPAALAETVRARHGTCAAPGCRTPAHRCDLDHTIRHDPATGTGPTSPDNLSPLCRPHHRLKHLPGWHVTLEADGSTVWTTPSGHTHTAEPSVVGPVRATHHPARPGPGTLALLRDPGLATRLAARTAEAPF